MWLLTVARVQIHGRNKEGKNCFDLAENKNKKFERKVIEVLNFAKRKREEERRTACFIIHSNSVIINENISL